jgi:E3 SUMO-protein ligase RanBP2
LSFNFGQSTKTSEKTLSSPISIFGANKTETPNTSGLLFGTQSSNTSTTGGNDKSFSFGSPGKSFDFQFQTKSSPVKSPERAETSDEDIVEEAEDVHFTPVIPLPDKIDVKTGEEDEDILYSHRAKLFKFDKDTKEWKERGLGEIKLLRHVETNKLRLLMRRDQVLKLCLNHTINSSIEITPKDEKTWMWSAGDYSEGELEYMQLACRFKAPEIAQEFKQAIDNACNSIDFEKVEDTVESTKDSSSDIQVSIKSFIESNLSSRNNK